MIYADYEYYATVYRGTAMDEEQFCGLARKASAYVDYITMSRARSAAGDKLEAVQNCVCALAELEQEAGQPRLHDRQARIKRDGRRLVAKLWFTKSVPGRYTADRDAPP